MQGLQAEKMAFLPRVEFRPLTEILSLLSMPRHRFPEQARGTACRFWAKRRRPFTSYFNLLRGPRAKRGALSSLGTGPNVDRHPCDLAMSVLHISVHILGANEKISKYHVDIQICTKHGKAIKLKTYQKSGVPVHCFPDELLRSSQFLLLSPTQLHRYDTCCSTELYRCETATVKQKIIQRRTISLTAGHVQQVGGADA